MIESSQTPLLTQNQSENKGLSRICIILTLIVLLIASTIRSTILQFWGSSFPKGIGGPYFILSFGSLLFLILFGILYGVIRLKRKEIISTKQFTPNYIVQGITSGLFGICLVYSSPISRTPPIVFVVLSNLGIVFGIVFTKFLVKQKRNVNYFQTQVYISLFFLAASIAITIAGDVVSKTQRSTKFNGWSVFWMLITTIATCIGALFNVLQERYLKQTQYRLPNQEQKHINIIQNCFWTSFYQFIFMVAMFWVDLIPVFGYSHSLSSFENNFKISTLCFFFNEDCGYKNFIYGSIFALGYIVSITSIMILNKESANFSIYAIALQSPLSMLIFVITGLGTANVPLWSIIPSLFLIGTGIFIWKRWQIKQKRKQTQLKNRQLKSNESDPLE